jgi:hypothetical protein
MQRSAASLAIVSLISSLAGAQEALPGPDAAPREPEPPRLESRIAAVTLYSDQALVLRRGVAAATAGRSRLEVAGLPAQLRDEAVRARIVRGVGVKLASLEVLVRNRSEYRKAEAEEAARKLKEIEARRQEKVDLLQALDQELAIVSGLRIGQRPQGKDEKAAPAAIDPKVWEATLTFAGDAHAANRKRARELLLELDGIDEELAVAAAVAAKLQSARVLSSKSVVVELDAAAAGEVELELAYLVPGPGWWPRYDVRASVESGKIELTSYALVRQETGEDWAGVELTFSAAEPARAADLPELLAWHIGEAQGPPPAVVQSSDASAIHRNGTAVSLASSQGQAHEERQAAYAVIELPPKLEPVRFNKGQMAAPGGKASRTREVLDNISRLQTQNDTAARNSDWANFVAGNRKLEAEFQNLDTKYQQLFEAEFLGCQADIARGERLLKSARLADGIVPPVRSSRGYDYKYQALRPETIPSDGAFNKVVLGTEELLADFVYETAPALLELCFLTTKVRNQRRQPYLEGPSSVFLGPDFIGDGRIPTTARGEQFPVHLGADESVAVRRSAAAKRETTGFFTSWHKYRHDVAVTVKNQKGRRVRVAVIDQVPYSDDEDVRIQAVETVPAPVEVSKKGLRRYELALEPGREVKVQFAYTVELPARKALARAVDGEAKW